MELEELKRKREERRKVLEEEERRRKQEEAERKSKDEVCLMNVSEPFPGKRFTGVMAFFLVGNH